MDTILNFLFLRRYRARKAGDKFLQCLQSEFAEGFLQLLLNLMSLAFFINGEYRKNIRDFEATYLFRSKDAATTAAAVFGKGRMKVLNRMVDSTSITVIFRDNQALMKYLLSPKPDILGSLLNQEITFDGNLNYLYKFAYMAKRLQLMAGQNL
ncbi:MAG: hypothetical protein ACMUIA_00865 [bacterium]